MANAKIFLTAEWRHLILLNYLVEPAILEHLVPEGTELDTWLDKTYMSLVGFLFLDTRVLSIPIPFHRNFEEVNLRFYVRRQENDIIKRGVVFIKEIVPKRAVAFVANKVYGEKYVTLPMSHQIKMEGADLKSAGYTWQMGEKQYGMSARADGQAKIPSPGSQAEFITEHYWGYTRRQDGGTVEYQVEHPQWPIWNALSATFKGDGVSLYGESLGPYLMGEPASAFIAAGSRVKVGRGRLIVQ